VIEIGRGQIELFSAAFAPFTIALIVMLAIGVLEVVSLLVGFSPFGSIEDALPDVPDPDAFDAPDASGAADVGAVGQVLGWLSVGRLPLLMLLVIFLTTFGLSGWIVQWVAGSASGAPISPWLAAIPALLGGAFATRHLGRLLGRIFPRDHTEVASQKELIGSYATIIRGEARQGQPAEAKTTDLRGRSHYILLEPDDPAMSYGAGDRVFIVGQDKNIYRAVTRLSKPQE
jgi:hypothetical protein